MTTTLIEITIETIKDFTALLEDILQNPDEISWYRGVGKKSYELKPSLYRRKDFTNIIDFLELEKKIISRFKQRSIPYLPRALSDDWDNLSSPLSSALLQLSLQLRYFLRPQGRFSSNRGNSAREPKISEGFWNHSQQVAGFLRPGAQNA